MTDLDDVHGAMIARGAMNEHPPQLIAKRPDHEPWIGCGRGPDGHLVALREEQRKGPGPAESRCVAYTNVL